MYISHDHCAASGQTLKYRSPWIRGREYGYVLKIEQRQQNKSASAKTAFCFSQGWSMTLGTETTLNMFVVLHFWGRKNLPTKERRLEVFFFVGMGLVASGLVLLMLCCLAKSLGMTFLRVWWFRGELVSKNAFGEGGHMNTHLRPWTLKDTTDPQHPKRGTCWTFKDSEMDEGFPIHFDRRHLQGEMDIERFSCSIPPNPEGSTTCTSPLLKWPHQSGLVYHPYIPSLKQSHLRESASCRHLPPKATRS